jgi:hypothetical protein
MGTEKDKDEDEDKDRIRMKKNTETRTKKEYGKRSQSDKEVRTKQVTSRSATAFFRVVLMTTSD